MIKVFLNNGKDIEFSMKSGEKELNLVWKFQTEDIPLDKYLTIEGREKKKIKVQDINNIQYIDNKNDDSNCDCPKCQLYRYLRQLADYTEKG